MIREKKTYFYLNSYAGGNPEDKDSGFLDHEWYYHGSSPQFLKEADFRYIEMISLGANSISKSQ